MRKNLSRRVVTHMRRDSLAAIAFGKNCRCVSNTCNLRCQLHFARLDTRIVLTRGHLHEVDLNVSRVPGQSRARETANHKQFTSRAGIVQCTNALRVAGCDYPKFTSLNIVFIVQNSLVLLS